MSDQATHRSRSVRTWSPAATAATCTRCDPTDRRQYSGRAGKRPCRTDEASSDSSRGETAVSRELLRCVDERNSKNRESERDVRDSPLWCVLHGCNYGDMENAMILRTNIGGTVLR